MSELGRIDLVEGVSRQLWATYVDISVNGRFNRVIKPTEVVVIRGETFGIELDMTNPINKGLDRDIVFSKWFETKEEAIAYYESAFLKAIELMEKQKEKISKGQTKLKKDLEKVLKM